MTRFRFHTLIPAAAAAVVAAALFLSASAMGADPAPPADTGSDGYAGRYTTSRFPRTAPAGNSLVCTFT